MGDSALPYRFFFWTVDQIASMLQTSEATVRRYLFYVGRTTGVKSPKEMEAINIAPEDEAPIWRVEDRELRRWLKARGIRIYPPYKGRHEGLGDADEMVSDEATEDIIE